MSQPKPIIRSLPPPPRTKSGEQSAVRAYRQKLDSIADGQAPALEELNRALQEYLESDMPPPPAPAKP